MGTLRVIRDYLAFHRHEILWALAFAVIFDILRFGSFIRGFIRQIKNKLAEKSVERLRKRVKTLEQYRDRLAMYQSSDKALYLATLRFLLAVLVCMCTGELFLIAERLDMFFKIRIFIAVGTYPIFAFIFFALALFGGVQGLRLVALDTGEKVSVMIDSINSDIEKLKAKLPKT